MPIIKNGQIIENEWVLLGDEDKAGENALYPYARFLTDHENDFLPAGLYGIALDVADDVMTLSGKLGQVAIITINFPSFADGRGFSQARLLRERLGFTGEIRAVGHIIRDQYLYLLRSGVDAIDADRVSESEWQAAMDEISVFYQPALATGVPAYRLRLQQENNSAAAD